MMRSDNSGVVPEGTHVEATWQEYNTDKGVGDRRGGGPITYVVYLPRVLKRVRFLVTGCPEVAHRSGRLRENFMYGHFSCK